MKKYLIIIAAVLFTQGVVIAQEPFRQELAVGASFGLNFSSVTFNPKISTKLMPGYNAGLMIRWNTEKNIGLQAEINYSIQGWEEDFTDYNNAGLPYDPSNYKEPGSAGGDPFIGTLAYKREVAYIEVPLMTHIYFGSKTFKFYINAGPKFAYYLDEAITSNINTHYMNYVFEEKRKVEKFREHYTEQHEAAIKNKFEWGLCGGPGIELNTKAGIFLLEGRFSYSFNDIYSTKRGDGDFFSKASNQVITVKLAYIFPILK